MAKKLFDKIEVCGDCPYVISSSNPNQGMCKITGQQIYETSLDYSCPLPNAEE